MTRKKNTKRGMIQYSDHDAKHALKMYALRHRIDLADAFGVVVRAGLRALGEADLLAPPPAQKLSAK